MELARPVRGQHHHGRLGGADGPALGNRDREVGEEFEQEGLELAVGPVDLVEQEKPLPRHLKREKKRAGDRILVGVEVHVRVARLANREHLARELPFVKSRGRVNPLVALQPDQLPPEHGGERLRRFRLPHTWRAFEQERLAESKGKLGGGREPVVGDVLGVAHRARDRIRSVEPGDAAADGHRSEALARPRPALSAKAT